MSLVRSLVDPYSAPRRRLRRFRNDGWPLLIGSVLVASVLTSLVMNVVLHLLGVD